MRSTRLRSRRAARSAARRAFTLVELIIVIAIIGVLLALALPAMHAARAAARRVTCENNLKQIGMATQLFHDARHAFPRYRLCPAPWLGGTDLYCEQVAIATTHTSMNEAWWAPYDNRVGATDDPLADFDPSRAFLWPFVEGNLEVFRCPDGADNVFDSPTFGRPYQVGYAMSYISGGPGGQNVKKLIQGTTHVMFVWDHSRTPGCAKTVPPALPSPWKPFDDAEADYHYPASRHGGVFNVMFCDGHVAGVHPEDLDDAMFYGS